MLAIKTESTVSDLLNTAFRNEALTFTSPAKKAYAILLKSKQDFNRGHIKTPNVVPSETGIPLSAFKEVFYKWKCRAMRVDGVDVYYIA